MVKSVGRRSGISSVDSVETDGFSLGSDGPATSFADIGGGGGGIWSEDANSPIDLTGQTGSHTFNLDGTYDEILLHGLRFIYTGTDGAGFAIQVNSDTGSNYDRQNEDGSTTTGSSNVDFGVNLNQNQGYRGDIRMDGRWDHAWVVDSKLVRTHGLGSTRAVKAKNNSVSGPLDTITFLTPFGSETYDLQAEVYGADVA